MEEKLPTVMMRVSRYLPGEEKPHFQTYEVPYRRDMVVLDALNHIKEKRDPTLTFRWSCRMGICGSCGMNVNGKPVLTCESFLKDVLRREILVEPLGHFPVIKDLVVDIEDFMRKLEAVKPYLIRDQERPLGAGEYRQTQEEVDRFRQSSLCINCMICYAACPVYGEDASFLGPAAAALAYRYNVDSRDQGAGKRLPAVASATGVWECTFVGECSTACPKDVDPGAAIQRLKLLSSIEVQKRVLLPSILR